MQRVFVQNAMLQCYGKENNLTCVLVSKPSCGLLQDYQEVMQII